MQSPPLSGGEASSAVDDAYINGVYAGLNFRSLLTYGFSRNLPDVPIAEQLFTINGAVSAEAPPINFFSESAAFSSHHNEKLPDLVSVELPHYSPGGADSKFSPNHRVGNARTPQQRRRRKIQRDKISEKTRCLQKLLPWDKKMDMATVLEETYKYIKFLEAQVSVLQSMPNYDGGSIKESGGDLGRLNRQQLLQVVVNSPVAQTLLYSNGCCVYSIEQLVLLKKNAERKALIHQMLYGSNPNFMFS
ncbi:hypothetical protein DH2020_031477 [Rehmannia glutinosa]|uniref:BHLH domain-containing protein n=1 Tax=Rehmannia glutinosa TaxID=99300 RepID=A0ABR0VHZ7_REHGL